MNGKTQKGVQKMEARKVEATLVERESKAGNTYQCVVLKLTNTYEKVVFLDKAELELLKTTIPSFK